MSMRLCSVESPKVCVVQKKSSEYDQEKPKSQITGEPQYRKEETENTHSQF